MSSAFLLVAALHRAVLFACPAGSPSRRIRGDSRIVALPPEQTVVAVGELFAAGIAHSASRQPCQAKKRFRFRHAHQSAWYRLRDLARLCLRLLCLLALALCQNRTRR